VRFPSLFLFSLTLLAILAACPLAVSMPFAAGGGDAGGGLSARMERTHYESGDVVSLTVEYPMEGHVTFQVKNQANETILIETVEVSDGSAVLEFALDENAEVGSYGVFISGVSQDGNLSEPADIHFTVREKEDEPFLILGMDGYMVITAAAGVILVVSVLAARSRTMPRRRSAQHGGFDTGESTGTFDTPPEARTRAQAPQFIPETPIVRPQQVPAGAADEFAPPPHLRAPGLPGTGWRCPNCGSAVDGTHRFCTQCGTRRQES